MNQSWHTTIAAGSNGVVEEIRLSVEAADSQKSVMQFLAVLAYPEASDKHKRDPFSEALHAAIYKARIWHQRSGKHDSVALRTLVPPQFRRRRNQNYQGLINNGMHRIDQRLTAGNIAARFYFAGLRIPIEDSPVDFGTEKFVRIPVTLARVNEGVGGIEIVPPKTVRDALRDAIAVRDRQSGHIHYGATPQSGLDDAIENHRKSLWAPSLRVLHLAMALVQEFWTFPKVYSTPGAEFLMDLLQNPAWLRDALVRAESYRNLLAERIPNGEFDGAKAIRLLPQ